MAKLSEDINDIITQFMDDKQDRYNYSKYYYEQMLEETGDYIKYRKNMKKVITEYWNDRDFWGDIYRVLWADEWTDELKEQMKIDMKQAIKEHCQFIYKSERVKCDICGCQMQRRSLSRHKKKCKANNPDN